MWRIWRHVRQMSHSTVNSSDFTNLITDNTGTVLNTLLLSFACGQWQPWPIVRLKWFKICNLPFKYVFRSGDQCLAWVNSFTVFKRVSHGALRIFTAVSKSLGGRFCSPSPAWHVAMNVNCPNQLSEKALNEWTGLGCYILFMRARLGINFQCRYVNTRTLALSTV